MRLALVVLASWSLAGGCGGNEATTGAGGAASKAAQPAPPPTPPSAHSSQLAHAIPAVRPEPPPAAEPPALAGHDFTPMGKLLFVVGACGSNGSASTPEGFSQAAIDKHCKVLAKTQAEYQRSWLDKARPFFADKVPATVPKKVVYPFAGGDLSTALTVYPDADEITTMSLEPAGDPRTLAALNTPTRSGKPAKGLASALATVQSELRFLYRVNFSNTMNMIEAMRGGRLPTQLIFGLSALKVHGFEIVALRYFELEPDGAIRYLTDEDVAQAPPVSKRAAVRNRRFANAEVRFQRPGGRVQIYRHLQVNLDDSHLTKDPRVLAHLEAKGPVAAMTKAASYLLSWDGFSKVRDYLAKNVVWMASDATGIAPKWGKPAGFEYETYGRYVGPHMNAGNRISPNWRAEFEAQPRRPLGFRFGYYDKNSANHLVIMKKKS